MRYETRNLGDGARKHAVYGMPVLDPHDYWKSVTDVPCPVCNPPMTMGQYLVECFRTHEHGRRGTIRWHEAGFVPGSRICDGCGRFFQAEGSIDKGIMLVRDSRFDKIRQAPPSLEDK